MLLTIDYLKVDPWDALIARVNSEYGTELQPYSTQLESITAGTGTSTTIVIVPNQADTETNTQPPITRTEYTYDRLDLSTFFKGTGVKDLGGFTLPTNTFDVVNAVGEFNGIVFTLNDFDHVVYDTYNRVYSLVANKDSLRFVGRLSFRLVSMSKRQLQNVSNKFEFPLANTWGLGNTSDGVKMTAQYLTSGYDFTQERDFLKNLDKQSSWPSGRKLAAVIGNVTGDPWVCKPTSADWNIAFDLYGGDGRVQLVYNGRVLPRYSPRKDILNVAVLQLSNFSTNVAGYLLLHYN